MAIDLGLDEFPPDTTKHRMVLDLRLILGITAPAVPPDPRLSQLRPKRHKKPPTRVARRRDLRQARSTILDTRRRRAEGAKRQTLRRITAPLRRRAQDRND